MITPRQIKAARALLGITQPELATLAKVGVATIRRIESTDEISGTALTIDRIQKGLEQAGIAFLESDGREFGAGVRLRLKKRR